MGTGPPSGAQPVCSAKALKPCQGMLFRRIPAFNTHCPETSPEPKPLDPCIEPRILRPPGEISRGVHESNRVSFRFPSPASQGGSVAQSHSFLVRRPDLCATGLPFSRTPQVQAGERALFVTPTVRIPSWDISAFYSHDEEAIQVMSFIKVKQMSTPR